jgi:multidrug resistance efflux pump
MSTYAANQQCEQLASWPTAHAAVIEGRVESGAGIRHLAFGRTGRVLEILVEASATVRRGELLARLDCLDIREDVLIAEAELQLYRTSYSLRDVPTPVDLDIARERLALAQADLAAAIDGRDRLQSLFIQNGLVSKQEMEAAERRARVASLEAAVHQQAYERTERLVSAEEKHEQNAAEQVRVAAVRRARQVLSLCEIRAPLDAVVVEILARAGEGAAAAAPVLSVVAADPATRGISAWIPISSEMSVSVGQELKVRVPAARIDSLDATIARVAPVLTAKRARSTSGEPDYGLAVWLEVRQTLAEVPLHARAYLDLHPRDDIDRHNRP